MDLKEIMSISGHSGLFRFVSQGRNGIIVESFTDKKRMFVNASQKVSSLSDIAIFTDGEEVPLKDVMKKIHESDPGQQAPDPKSSPENLKQFMAKILPEYDRNRVYVSDIKKLVSWYNSLLSLNLLSFEEEVQPPAEAEAEAKSEVAPEAPSKKEIKAKKHSSEAKKTPKKAKK